MTRDPGEGIDRDGYVRTGAARDRVPAAYEPLIAEATGRLTAAYGDALHGLYVYGSVATGQARPPASDLDLLAVWRGEVPDDAATLAAQLSLEHRHLVREVGLASMALAELDAPGDVGVGTRAFLRHYCVPLHGADLRGELAPCRVDDALVRGFNGDLSAPFDRWTARLDAATSTAEVAEVARLAARRLLLAAATTLSVRHGGWSTDRGTAVELIRAHEPRWAHAAGTALRWCTGTEVTGRAKVQAWLAGFGRWVVTGCPSASGLEMPLS